MNGQSEGAGRSAARPEDATGELPFLEVQALRKVYGPVVALDDVDLSIKKGEMVAFLGPSGCGKTTSLRMIAGLSSISSGRVLVDGKDVTRLPCHQRDMGLVFQSYALFPHLTVARNVSFGLEMRKVPREEIRRRVGEALALVHLSGHEQRRPAELSGGQQQRVALARALVIQPSILLFDEPLSNLDAKLRDELRSEIRDIQRRLGITSIFVTHDQVEALTMCDRVAVLNMGKLEQFGTPEDLYERPETAFVAAFVGRTNRLSGEAVGDRVEASGTVLRTARAATGSVDVMIRPQRIIFAAVGASSEAGANSIAGCVIRHSFAGDLIQSEIDVGGSILSVEQPNRGGALPPPAGSQVELLIRPQDIMLFPASI